MKTYLCILIAGFGIIARLEASKAEVLMAGPFGDPCMISKPESCDPNAPDPTVRLFSMIPPEGRFELSKPVDAKAPKYALLPVTKERLDEDGFEYYAKAFEQLSELDLKPFRDWIKGAAKAANRGTLPELGADCDAISELINQAARCKKCKWPIQRIPQERGYEPDWPTHEDPELYGQTVQDLRDLGVFLTVMIHTEIAAGDYEKAGGLLATGFASVKQISSIGEVLFDLTAVDSISLYIQEIEYWISQPAAPSLYEALRNLPQPLLSGLSSYSNQSGDLVNPIPMGMAPGIYSDMEDEETDISQQVLPWPNNPRGIGLEAIPVQVDRWLAALELVEGLRLWVSWNDGLLPESLSEMTELRLPLDPVSRLSFYYDNSSSAATIEAPKTGNPVFDTEKLKYAIRMK